MIVVELTAAVDDAGGTRTFYMSDRAYTTGPTDTPPNVSFETRVMDPGDVAITIYRDGPTGGASVLEVGNMVLANLDGGLDAWKNYGFDQRSVIIREGDASGRYPADFTTILAGAIGAVVVGTEEIDLTLLDRSSIFDLPILTVRYAGSNPPGDHVGVEGTADDIGGSLKPMVFGRAREISPPCVNASTLTYQPSNGALTDIPAVYVRGAAQTHGADYPTVAQLQAAIVAGGTYVTCLAAGMFRVGAQDGQVTCDALDGTSASRTAGQLLYRLARLAGLSPAEINYDDVVALDVKTSAELGKYVDDQTTFLDAMNQIAQSVGAWFSFDLNNVFRMGRLEAPTGDVVDTLQAYDCLQPVERTSLQNMPVPAWSVTIEHTRIETTQTSGLVGTVTADRLAYLKDQYRQASASDASIQLKYKSAASLDIESCLTDANAANAESQRMLALWRTSRDVFTVPLDVSRFAELVAKGLWLGGEIGLNLDRFGLSGGKAFVLLGVSYQRKSRIISLTVWGGDRYVASAASVVSAIGLAAGMGAAATAAQQIPGTAAAAGAANGQGGAQSLGPGATTGGYASGLLLAVTTTGSGGGGAQPQQQVGTPKGMLMGLTGSSGVVGGGAPSTFPAAGAASGQGAGSGRSFATVSAGAGQAAAAGVGSAFSPNPTVRQLIGVSTNISQNPSKYTAANIVSKMAFLGLTRVRDGINWLSTVSASNFAPLVSAGLKLHFYYIEGSEGFASISTIVTRMASIESGAPGTVVGIEGGVQVDNHLTLSYSSQTGYGAWHAWTVDFYTAVKANSNLTKVPVIGPSVASVANFPSL